ncbi:Cobalt-zinc-cadmium resistance protein CzcA [BD1-7 clade bacterium]|uniref:Cobalt-zinc-cadmium resistance protein CzcA n=1 Tax=BD1-7 clade bacterium TaxID=2029982 RepID=A0A5S9QBF3_9GAMM|nr:Cobalt-zinc-cadmium resistance protein CzcA [BD1-7 clade bacterium]
MHTLIAFFARRAVAANGLMLVIVVLGCWSLWHAQREILPRMLQDGFTITTRASSPSLERHESVCLALEQVLTNKNTAIESLHSLYSARQCTLIAQLPYGSPMEQAIDNAKQLINTVKLPADFSPVDIQRHENSVMISRISIGAQTHPEMLHNAARQLKTLLNAKGLEDVRLRDRYQPEVDIQVDPQALIIYQLPFSQLSDQLEHALDQLRDLPPTALMQQLAATQIQLPGKQEEIPLADIALLERTVAPLDGLTKVDDNPAATVSVYQDNFHSIDTIAAHVDEAILELQQQLPDTYDIKLIQDNSQIFYNRTGILQDNAIAGLMLVFLVLFLFMRIRLAFWVTVGIPVAFLGAFITLWMLGYSINMVSTFALLLVLGMVVDDAIIVGESIDREQHLTTSDDGLSAVIKGAVDVYRPVLFATLTTIVSFAPLAFLPGAEGRLIGQIPWVVIATLAFSLVECLLILPAHLRHRSANTRSPRLCDRPHWLTERLLKRFTYDIYQPVLVKGLAWRYLLITLFFATLVLVFSQVASGRIAVQWLSNIESEVATATVTVAPQDRLAYLPKLTQQLEKSALKLQEELNTETGHQEVRHVRAHIPIDSNTGYVYLTLASGQDRRYSGALIDERWQSQTGLLEHAIDVQFSSRFQTSTDGFWLQLFSTDKQQLQQASDALLQQLSSLKGVSQVQSSLQNTQADWRLILPSSDAAASQALQASTPSTAENELLIKMGYWLKGQTLRQSDVNDDQDALAVTLTLADHSPAQLLQLPVDQGRHVLPFHAIADVLPADKAEQVTRSDGRYTALISAKLQTQIITTDSLYHDVFDQWLPAIQADFPDVEWHIGGLKGSQRKLSERLMSGFGIALMVIFLLTAWLFRSWSQPILILTAVPFGMLGAIAGHALLGYPLTVWSIAGMLAVSGIVVNDNMVLIYSINARRQSGEPTAVAVVNACTDRLRPILLTSITTFVGLLPIMSERSWEAQFLVPMAIATGFGVLLATAVSLLLIPAVYLVVADLSGRQTNHCATTTDSLS